MVLSRPRKQRDTVHDLSVRKQPWQGRVRGWVAKNGTVYTAQFLVDLCSARSAAMPQSPALWAFTPIKGRVATKDSVQSGPRVYLTSTSSVEEAAASGGECGTIHSAAVTAIVAAHVMLCCRRVSGCVRQSHTPNIKSQNVACRGTISPACCRTAGTNEVPG